MKIKLLIILLLFALQIGYSQIERSINGVVLSNDFRIQSIEVVNLTSKKTTITNNSGNFSILARSGDTLVFISTKYEYKTVILKQVDFEKTNFMISLIKKAEELDEVVVTKISFPHVKIDNTKLSQIRIKNETANLKNPFVYDGTIQNGITKIIRLYRRDNNIPKIGFKEYATKELKPDFYGETLTLKTEEVALFLEFCDADPRSINITKNPNVLSLMDFLFIKNEEFKKLQSTN